MRYWSYLGGKLALGVALMYGVLLQVARLWPANPKHDPIAPLGHGADWLLCDLALMLWFLACCGVLYMIIWDQRYRCRTCLRRLRMPVEKGSWGRMLQFGRPQIEYICPYGHGTLKEDELQITGLNNAEWTPNSDDIWDELYAASKDSSDRP